MYKYINLALIFGVSLFVATAHATDVFTPTPRTPGITIDTDSSDNIASFDMPQTEGGAITYYVHYSLPSGWSLNSGTQNVFYIDRSSYRGGAFYHPSSDVYGGFIRNTASNNGGAMYIGTGTSVTGDFINNAAYGDGGGALNMTYNSRANNLIDGLFINNQGDNDSGGGAINGWIPNINAIRGDFIGNWGSGGGAILFFGNTGSSVSSTGSLASIEGNFVVNRAVYEGGAINIGVPVGRISNSLFYGNTAGTYGGAIINHVVGVGTIGTISDSAFYNNSAGQYGGAIYNAGTIGNITNSVFYGNKMTTANDNLGGGAIYNTGTITNITADFLYNSSVWDAGAVFNSGTIGRIVGNFEHNSAKYAGAFYNSGGGTVTITGNFLYNSASSHSGAIFNYGTVSNKTSTLNLLADTQDMTFYGNTDPTEYNDINNTRYSSTPVINMNAATGRKISFGGTVRGSEGALNLNNDSSADNRGGQYVFNNTVSGNSFNLYNFGQFC